MPFFQPTIEKWAFLFFMILVVGPTGEISAGDTLNEKKVQSILNQMDKAIREKDAHGHVRFMAPDISIRVTVKDDTGTHFLKMNREQYRQHLMDAFEAVDDYSFSRSIVEIKIEGGGKRATVITRITEKITMRGKTLQTVTREISELEVIKGKIWVTSLEAVSKVDPHQGFET